MFDIGFWEISLILVVMLIVIGPERLPGVVRKIGLWIGKARRMVAEVKVEVDRELQLYELKRSIKEQSNFDELRQLAQDVRNMDTDIQKEARTIKSDIQSPLERTDRGEDIEEQVQQQPASGRPEESPKELATNPHAHKVSAENTVAKQPLGDDESSTTSEPTSHHRQPPTN